MTRWRPIALSGKQRKAADHVGGAELILPWPPGLPPGAPVTDIRDATAAERAAAEQIVGPAAARAGLVPVRVEVAVLDPPNRWPGFGAPGPRLVVLLIGRRWVHATGAPDPVALWYKGAIELM